MSFWGPTVPGDQMGSQRFICQPTHQNICRCFSPYKAALSLPNSNTRHLAASSTVTLKKPADRWWTMRWIPFQDKGSSTRLQIYQTFCFSHTEFYFQGCSKFVPHGLLHSLGCWGNKKRTPDLGERVWFTAFGGPCGENAESLCMLHRGPGQTSQNVPCGIHTGYHELKLLKEQPVQGHSDLLSPALSPESRKQSHVKGALPVLGRGDGLIVRARELRA